MKVRRKATYTLTCTEQEFKALRIGLYLLSTTGDYDALLKDVEKEHPWLTVTFAENLLSEIVAKEG